MITLHPTAKKFGTGFLPMIAMRNAKGQMVGSRCPQGDAKDWRTHDTALQAEIDARCVALKAAARNPECVQVA